MAEIAFFMNNDDTREFAEFLIREFECRFTLDGADRRELPETRSSEEVACWLDPDGYRPRFFVTSPRWSDFPLVVHETTHNDGRRRWYVEQRCGGPAFDYLVSKPRQVDGQPQMIPGWLMDYPWYYVRPGDPTTFERPAGMTKAFQAVKRFLRRNAVRTRRVGSAQAGPWVMLGAVSEFEQGCWLRQGDMRFEPARQKRL